MTANSKRRAGLYLILLLPIIIIFLIFLRALVLFSDYGLFTLNTGTLKVESGENFHLCVLKNGTLDDFDLIYPFKHNISSLFLSQLNYEDGFVKFYLKNESDVLTKEPLRHGLINSSSKEFTANYSQPIILYLGQTVILEDEGIRLTLLKNDSKFRREMCYQQT